MSSSGPINIAAIEAKQAQAATRQMLAEQVLSKDRLTESLEQAFNPAAAERMQARLNRFRPLETRRKVEGKEHARIEEVEKKTEEDLAHEFSRRNQELPADRLRSLRRALHEGSTEQDILDQVNTLFSDPTLADEALEYLDQSTSGALQERVRRARDILNSEKGREIIAGRNIDPAAKAFYNKGLGESPTELRDLYRDITGNPRDHNTLFTELSGKYGYDELKRVVAFLLQGMGYDLKSKGCSIQQAELMRLMTDVRNLQSILWVYLFFKGRMRHIRARFAKGSLRLSKNLTFEKLSQDFIKLVEERYPTVVKLMKMLEDLGLDDESKLIILSQYMEATRMLSPRLYKSPRHKQDLLSLLIEALTELEEEDEDESV